MIRVQEQDFDLGAELQQMREGNTAIGGLCSFVGLVRDMAGDANIGAMTLEHYPGMTERALEEIETEAHARWPLEATLIIHRYGIRSSSLRRLPHIVKLPLMPVIF